MKTYIVIQYGWNTRTNVLVTTDEEKALAEHNRRKGEGDLPYSVVEVWENGKRIEIYE